MTAIISALRRIHSQLERLLWDLIFSDSCTNNDYSSINDSGDKEENTDFSINTFKRGITYRLQPVDLLDLCINFKYFNNYRDPSNSDQTFFHFILFYINDLPLVRSLSITDNYSHLIVSYILAWMCVIKPKLQRLVIRAD